MAQSSGPGQLITFRNDRLGGRLMALVNTMRVAETYDLPFAVHWHEATDVGKVFNDPKLFFASGWVDEHFISREDFEARRDRSVRFDQLTDTSIDGIRDLLAKGRDILFVQPFGYSLVGDETDDEVAKLCNRIWRNFPFAESLAPDLAAFSEQLDGATAYHIRRGDIITEGRPMNRAWPGKYTPEQYFNRHMARSIGAGAKPVVFSDHAGTIDRFARRFPDLIPIDRLLSSSHLTEGQRDLMELYAMSTCARIIAPASSAFSSTATALGGCPKLDVTEDLSPDDIVGAKQDLVDYLAEAAEHGEIDSPGDLAQMCQHLADDLAEQDRQPEAAKIIGGLIDAGLNISFLYPLAMQQMLDAGDLDAIVATGRHLSTRMLYHRKDAAEALALLSLAYLEKGELDLAGTTALRGYWHGPDTPLVRQLLGTYFAVGALDGSPFPPVSAALLGLRRRSAPVLDRFSGFAALRRKLDILGQKGNLVPGVASIEWDWGPLMRAFNPARIKDDPQRERIERGLEMMQREGTGADIDSLSALYAYYLGKKGQGINRLTAATDTYPEEAIVWHRLALAHWYERDFDHAEEAADRTVELDPTSPARRGFRGIIRNRTRDYDGAIEDLNAAIDGGVSVPMLYLVLADVLRRKGNLDDAIKVLDRGVAFSPREQEPRFLRARMNLEAGRADQSLTDLEALISIDTRAPKVLLLHADCLIAKGSHAEAEDFLEGAIKQAADGTKLREKRAELRAKNPKKSKKKKKG